MESKGFFLLLLFCPESQYRETVIFVPKMLSYIMGTNITPASQTGPWLLTKHGF